MKEIEYTANGKLEKKTMAMILERVLNGFAEDNNKTRYAKHTCLG